MDISVSVCDHCWEEREISSSNSEEKRGRGLDLQYNKAEWEQEFISVVHLDHVYQGGATCKAVKVSVSPVNQKWKAGY